MKQNAIARLNREFKAGISDEQLAKLVTFLREHDALCVINPEERRDGARILVRWDYLEAKVEAGSQYFPLLRKQPMTETRRRNDAIQSL